MDRDDTDPCTVDSCFGDPTFCELLSRLYGDANQDAVDECCGE